MRGKVVMINHHIGWIGIKTENNIYSIVEILEMSLPSIGDIVSGELESLGGETFFNLTSQEELEVFVQDLNDDSSSVMKQLKIFKGNKHQWELF